jgi:hypothetical protein
VKNLGFGAVLLGMAAVAPLAHATLLAPGGSCILTCTTISSLPGGTIIANTGVLAGTGTSLFAASLQTVVYKETATGDLDFLYQYTVNSATGTPPDLPDQFQAQLFGNYTTNVQTLTTGGIGGMLAGTDTTTPDIESRTAGGGTINFEWLVGNPGVGQTSDILVIETNATSYQGATDSIEDDGVESFASYEPGTVPEPASIVLFGTASLLAAFFLRRRLAPKAQ